MNSFIFRLVQLMKSPWKEKEGRKGRGGMGENTGHHLLGQPVLSHFNIHFPRAVAQVESFVKLLLPLAAVTTWPNSL